MKVELEFGIPKWITDKFNSDTSRVKNCAIYYTAFKHAEMKVFMVDKDTEMISAEEYALCRIVNRDEDGTAWLDIPEKNLK